MIMKLWSKLCQIRLTQYVFFYFLALGRVAEGDIGINWPNVIAMLIFIAVGIGIGRLM